MFHQERAGGPGLGDVLITDAPAAIRPFDDVIPLRRVTVIGVVVAGVEIAVIVEAELLRVAETIREHFEVCPVRIAAQHTARIRISKLFTLFRNDVETAIAAGKIKFPIRPESQPVQIMAFKTKSHPVTGRHDFAFIAHAGFPVVAQHPQVGHVCKINIPLPLEHPGGNAIFQRIETIRPDHRAVASPTAGTVFEQPDAVGILRQLLP